MSVPLHVLYADSHVLVVCKPARLLTASDKTGDETLIALARAWHSARQEPGKKGYLAPLHFLDRPVSGVVMLALSSKAAQRLSAQFRERRIEKIYRAIVEGGPETQSGVLEDWLLKDKDSNVVETARPGTPGAKACRLGFRCLGRAGSLALLEIRPETGRSHQIRVQLASRGMPIYGDRKYRAKTTFDGAIALHAFAVRFEHPVTKETVLVRTPVPDSWRAVWPGKKDLLDVQETEA